MVRCDVAEKENHTNQDYSYACVGLFLRDFLGPEFTKSYGSDPAWVELLAGKNRTDVLGAMVCMAGHSNQRGGPGHAGRPNFGGLVLG